MARTLPWLKAGAKATLSRPQTTKTHRTVESNSEDEALPSTTDASTPRRRSSARPARSDAIYLPTSAAASRRVGLFSDPGPAGAKHSYRFMVEGLDRDDIYVMVEDEFHAVAKQFTQHLHHAEYKRLKNLAKTRNVSAITTISRPTDSITEMRQETKKKKDHETKAAKQKLALAHIKGQAAAKRLRIGSDVESDVEVTRGDDLWAGTTLQGLMTSPSKKQTSLTGLQGVLSSTRAAAGFSKPECRVSQTNYFDLDPQAGPQGQAMHTASSTRVSAGINMVDGDSTATDEDDDLDAPSVTKRPFREGASSYLRSTTTTNPSSRAKIATTRNPSLPSLPSPPRMRHNPLRPTSSPSNTTFILKRNKTFPVHDILDDIPRPTTPQSEVSKRIMKRRADMNSRKLKEVIETKGSGSVNEIPIFLV
ncbi:hypothetical protein MMC18_003546 [Xylographa bjoerkii]|nr:hypothetical protein [Xylographa bjoerkii]